MQKHVMQLPENLRIFALNLVDSRNTEILSLFDRVRGDLSAVLVSAKDGVFHRIEAGKYGFCEECGIEIPLVELLDNPYLTRCSKHRQPEDTLIPMFEEAVHNYKMATGRFKELNIGDGEDGVIAKHHPCDRDTSSLVDRTVVVGWENSCFRKILQIVGALQRLAQGTYGVCVKCQGDIPLPQLWANPASFACVRCPAN
ncbi:hypothetical protein HGA64_02630 [Candidatus Falkowbacteria bacterium]|nr:hypothetical protein [Candidatus Falkowbacteria bacterium]